MKKSFICCLVAFLFSVPVVVNPIFADDDMSDKDEKIAKYVKKSFAKMAQELEFTDEQKVQIEEIMQADKQRAKEIAKQIRQKDKLINEELLKENYDRTIVNNLLQEMRQLGADMAQHRIDSKIKIRSVLTKDQFAKIQKAKEEMLAKKANKSKSSKNNQGKKSDK